MLDNFTTYSDPGTITYILGMLAKVMSLGFATGIVCGCMARAINGRFANS